MIEDKVIWFIVDVQSQNIKDAISSPPPAIVYFFSRCKGFKFESFRYNSLEWQWLCQLDHYCEESKEVRQETKSPTFVKTKIEFDFEG